MMPLFQRRLWAALIALVTLLAIDVLLRWPMIAGLHFRIARPVKPPELWPNFTALSSCALTATPTHNNTGSPPTPEHRGRQQLRAAMLTRTTIGYALSRLFIAPNRGFPTPHLGAQLAAAFRRPLKAAAQPVTLAIQGWPAPGMLPRRMAAYGPL